MYTLTDIYNRLTTNATATEGNHSLSSSENPAGTMYTLKQIYEAIPTIDATKILQGTTYLGVGGTILTRTLSASSETVNAGYYTTTTLSAVDSDLLVGSIKSGITIFGIAGSYAGKKLVDTGQTGCWDVSGNPITCGQSPAGQDAEYTSSNSPSTCEPSYTNNNDGTITDNCTGLMWKRCSEGQTYNAETGNCDDSASTYTWENALTQCEGLTFPSGSYSDWRMPNIKELLSIVNYEASGSEPAINTTYFPSTVSDYYWSSTSRFNVRNLVWLFGFSIWRNTVVDDKSSSHYLYCVRQ